MLDETVSTEIESTSTKPAEDRIKLSDRSSEVNGEFTEFQGERYYVINNVGNIPPFFISVVSNSDHWLFISSNGGLTAGRVSPDTPLFPYITSDKIHDSTSHTGSKSIFRVVQSNKTYEWEPFNLEHEGRFKFTRKLYKNVLGNKLCFEEINHDLGLVYRYTWMNSEAFGFVRECELINQSSKSLYVSMIDGLQNIMPAGTASILQANSSNLVDAYKLNEVDEASSLAYFSLNSGITDKPEPLESLRANTVFCIGLSEKKILLSTQQIKTFKQDEPLQQELETRGVRGSYLVNASFNLSANDSKSWKIVADVDQDQGQVSDLRELIINNQNLELAIEESIENGSDELRRIMAKLDGLQITNEENVSVHHYANVLFNGMRGGVYDNQYLISSKDFRSNIRHFNVKVYERNEAFLHALPETLSHEALLSEVKNQEDINLERLCYEYLPLTFGRRHGDPSRPWNKFAINLKDKSGNNILDYQGNWRDIFQNWEAISISYPEFIENIISKFVNASTVDGYNPYRITKQGIDWEVEEPEDPWSFIGYWGDHQIIYLLKLLELSNNYHPSKLEDLLHRPIFSYANVPYRIKSFESIVENSKSTVTFDQALAQRIEQRTEQIGADGKLLTNSSGDVYLVNLTEKLLVPLLSKLSNLILDGGIWLNTQRPEWNDANNAIVGNGLSMVTLYYMRRYVNFLNVLFEDQDGSVSLSSEVAQWMLETIDAIESAKVIVKNGDATDAQRFDLIETLGKSAAAYRHKVYSQEGYSGSQIVNVSKIKQLCDDSLVVMDSSIESNQKKNGLYHAYNLLNLQGKEARVDKLYTMLEGQVSVLSSGAINGKQAVDVLDALFDTDLFQMNQQSFMLYPDRKAIGFLDKNCIAEDEVKAVPKLMALVDSGDKSIVYKDVSGKYRFNAALINKCALDNRLDLLIEEKGDAVKDLRLPLHRMYAQVFNHKEFTGRSGGMFGFEGLGSIYWHMVSKLLLAVQEMYFASLDLVESKDVSQSLGQHYYQVREGIGFNKTPAEYGAFPTDPYSHTPGHSGAQQPGMTGQVKEEVLTRFGELGVRVSNGIITFQPCLLRKCEFLEEPKTFDFLTVLGEWQQIDVPKHALAFTWCQIPILYTLDAADSCKVELKNGDVQAMEGFELTAEISDEIFKRTDAVKAITLHINAANLFRA